jgi:hypothetical protein
MRDKEVGARMAWGSIQTKHQSHSLKTWKGIDLSHRGIAQAG